MTLGATDAFLNVPGEMAALMREKDWSDTPFGPVENWSTALRSAVSICLGSRFPIVLYWGETRALIYNDAWSPVPGRKHPWALGRPGPEVWSEIWDIIGPMFDHVMDKGEATWSDDQLLPLNRFGYVEECYFYYSYSPVRGESGTVEGIFTAVTETTYRVLSERRERLLREISEVSSRLNSATEACQAAVKQLVSLPEEAPFALAYLRDAETGSLTRVSCEKLCDDDVLSPLVVTDGHDPSPWKFQQALRNGSTTVEGLERFGSKLPSDPWPEALGQAVVVPILSARSEAPYGFLVAGASARRRVNADYVTLFERAAAHISTAIANAEAYAEERLRAERLAELDRAKTAFFSNASHEFRTPLALMLGPVEDILQRGGSSGSISVDRAELSLVQRNGQRLLRLVNTLLDFSRIEAGRAQASFEQVDLAAYTAELASSFQSAMQRAGLEYVIDCPPLSQAAWVDRDMWEKVVLNLISNAFKYTLDGRVRVSLREEDGAAVLRVADTGVGIPEAELLRVFERFHRIEGQQGRTHEGTGIGLALVKDLAALHGGEATVESEPGNGSTFSVTVPLVARSSHASSQPVQQSTATKAETFVAEAERWLPDASGDADLKNSDREDAASPKQVIAAVAGCRILVADDNADMRGYILRLLREAGYRAEGAVDGVDAFEQISRDAPDLLLSDVMMPRLDGFGLIGKVRSVNATAELPIILLSARAGEESSIEGLAAGADDYLVKPFSARELLARVEGSLRLSKLRNEASEALREANEELETRVAQRTRERDKSWNVSHDLIGIADTGGIWLSINPAWQRTLGWKAEEIVGRTSEWMEHPEDVRKTRREVEVLSDGRTTFDFVNRFRTASGDYRTLSWTAVPEDGYLYCVARDVTDEQARLVELQNAQDALRQSQKMEAVGQLTGGIAHDFNNLLTGITGSLDLLNRRLSQGRLNDVDKYVVAAQGAAKRAAALTHRLLAFSRQQTLDPKPTNVNRLVGDLEELVRRSVGPQIEIEVVGAAGLWPVLVDPHQLENALLNLAINARDAMPEGGRLTIETANKWLDDRGAKERDLPAGQYVSLCVTDTGTGMAPDVIAKAFDPFFTTKPLGQGTGLGLSMIYGFVRQSGGQVRIYSELGKGTTMCLYLPRHLGGSEAEGLIISPSTLTEGDGQTVLVVDDEATVRLLVSEVLEDAGFRVLEAADGPTGLAMLQSNVTIDLLITDVGLPGGMNGRQVADQARSLRPELKVLFITGYAENAAFGNGHLEPGFELLTKPFAVDELSSKVTAIIGSPQ